jgi:hypothetical protein
MSAVPAVRAARLPAVQPDPEPVLLTFARHSPELEQLLHKFAEPEVPPSPPPPRPAATGAREPYALD